MEIIDGELGRRESRTNSPKVDGRRKTEWISAFLLLST
jgi:hypothetical protein